MIMPFGKHKGETLAEIPIDYLRWLYNTSGIRGELYSAVEDELEERADEELIKDYT